MIPSTDSVYEESEIYFHSPPIWMGFALIGRRIKVFKHLFFFCFCSFHFVSFRFGVCFFSLCFCYFVFILAHNFDVSYFFKIELVMLFIVVCNQPAADCCWKWYRTCYIKYPIEHTSIRSFFLFSTMNEC